MNSCPPQKTLEDVSSTPDPLKTYPQSWGRAIAPRPARSQKVTSKPKKEVKGAEWRVKGRLLQAEV